MMYKYLHYNVQVSNLLYENQLWITQFWPENRTAEEKASWQLASLHQDEAEEIQIAQPEIPCESKKNYCELSATFGMSLYNFTLQLTYVAITIATLENLVPGRSLSVACQHIN